MKLAMYHGEFERRTGWDIDWVQIPDQNRATQLLNNGHLDMTVADSANIARMFTRQAKVKLIWIEESLELSESLIVHDRYHGAKGGTVRTPMDLRGLRIGVEFGTTSHYALETYYNEFFADVVHDSAYQRLSQCAANSSGLLIPCHYQNQTAAVTFYGMTPDDIERAYNNGTIHAAYIGFPHLYRMRPNGTVILTNAEMTMWQKATFRGLVATQRFLERPGVTEFLKAYFITMARANFYWYNNTKEFTLYYPGNFSVSAKIARVLPNGYDREAFDHISELEFPTLREQVSQKWMGGGLTSRVAYALRDHAMVFNRMKEDHNVVPLTETPSLISSQDYRYVRLADVMTIEQYVEYLDPSYVQLIVDQNITDAYHLDPEDVVHLGYQISDVHGPTISILTPDNCSSYPSAKYPTSVLTDDIKALPKCRCQEYYLFGKCPGDEGYSPLGYYCLRRNINNTGTNGAPLESMIIGEKSARRAAAAVVAETNPNCANLVLTRL